MKQCSLVLVIKGKVPVRPTGPLTRSEEGSATTAKNERLAEVCVFLTEPCAKVYHDDGGKGVTG